MLRRTLARPYTAVLTLATATLLASACSNAQRLADYDYRGRSLGVVTIAPPHPAVLNDMDLDLDADNPLEALARVGAEIAREVSAEKLRARLDTAATAVNVSDRMGDRVLRSSARYLRARPVEDAVANGQSVDYELEIRVHRYGITADSWSAGAYFMIDAGMMLLDGKTGRRIWVTDVHATKPVRNSDLGIGNESVTSIVTAVRLSELSTQEIERALGTLADFAADHIVNEFSKALDEARG